MRQKTTAEKIEALSWIFWFFACISVASLCLVGAVEIGWINLGCRDVLAGGVHRCDGDEAAVILREPLSVGLLCAAGACWAYVMRRRLQKNDT